MAANDSSNMNGRARRHPLAALMVLVVLHFLVDFYGGLLVPLPEPTLTSHLNTNIGVIALLIGGWALLVNLIQPFSGWILPRRGLPILLLLTPFAAAFTTLIGLTQSFPMVIAILFIAAAGVGILHPEAALAVQSLGGRHAGAAVGLFMAAGYFGFASGSMASGIWVEMWGLHRFWLLFLPALLMMVAVALSGLHRLEGHITAEEAPAERPVGFPAVFGIGIGVAVTMCLLVRFITILLVRGFPDAPAQGWGGATVFATGITGAIGAFAWGYLADRIGAARVLTWLNAAAIPLVWQLTRVEKLQWAPVWGLGIGLTIGSAFPLVVVLARQARGCSQRLRMGLVIGGSWGLGETMFILGGYYLNRFPVNDPQPVVRILRLCLPLLLATTLLAWHTAKKAGKTKLAH